MRRATLIGLSVSSCLQLALLQVANAEDLTLLLRNKKDCGAPAYFGEAIKRLVEPGEAISISRFAFASNGHYYVPTGARQYIADALGSPEGTAMLVLEGTLCFQSGTLAKDAAFWRRVAARGIRYVSEADLDEDGFVWHLNEFRRKAEKGERLIVYVSGLVYNRVDGYYLLFPDFYRYFDESRVDLSVVQHGYPLNSLIKGLRDLDPSELNVIVDGVEVNK